MKKFLIKTILFCFPVLAACITLAFLADGYSDSSYMRFTTPRQQSLILGTSRSATGIIPGVLDSALVNIFPSLQMNNFSFTLLQTPYGKVYYDVLKKKLDPAARNSLFILAVDPWSVSTFKNKYGDSTDFTEKELAPGNMYFLSMRPNVEYLLKNYQDPYFKLIQNRLSAKSPFFLHTDGWFEVSINLDSTTVAKRTKKELDIYREEYFPSCKLSAFRLDYVHKTIELLKIHGDVYLLRMPVSQDILAIENKLEPRFDSLITQLAMKTGTPYLNFNGLANRYAYTDGIHLEKNAARKLSLEIASLIQKNKSSNNPD